MISRLLTSCPGGERQELLLKALRVAAPMGDTAGQLARAVVEDDVQRTQVPSLLVTHRHFQVFEGVMDGTDRVGQLSLYDDCSIYILYIYIHVSCHRIKIDRLLA